MNAKENLFSVLNTIFSGKSGKLTGRGQANLKPQKKGGFSQQVG